MKQEAGSKEQVEKRKVIAPIQNRAGNASANICGGAGAIIAPATARVLVSSHGCEWAAANVAAHLGAEVAARPDPCRLRLLVGYYNLGGPVKENAELMAAERRVVWWVGTDILWLEQSGNRAQRVAWLNENVHENWAEWELSAERLRAVGLKNVRVVAMPTRRLYSPLPLPERFTVGCYSYDSRAGFYGRDVIEKAARLTPDVEWMIYPCGKNRRVKNVEYVGRVGADEMELIYRRMSVHVRIVNSDGMPQGPMEAAMCGRPVVYNFRPMDFIDHLPNPTAETLAARVRYWRDEQAAGRGYMVDAAKYWSEFNSPQRLRDQVARVLQGG